MDHPPTPQERQADYDGWFVAEVDKGLADLNAGQLMTDAEAAADMAQFFADLAQENHKAA